MSKQLNIKKTRKHKGIHQTGGNKGKLKKGFKYSGKRLKSGLPQIIQVGGMEKNKYRQQLEDTILFTPEDHYNNMKDLVPQYEIEIHTYINNNKKKLPQKFSKKEIEKKFEYLKINRPKKIAYEKKNKIFKDSHEEMSLYNEGEIKIQIKEAHEKISEANKLIWDISRKIENPENKSTRKDLKGKKDIAKKYLSNWQNRGRLLLLRRLELKKTKVKLAPIQIQYDVMKDLPNPPTKKIKNKKKKVINQNLGGKVKNLEKRFKKLLTLCS